MVFVKYTIFDASRVPEFLVHLKIFDIGLVLINNAELDLPNMWIAYLPMFIGVYVLTQWLDRKIGN